MDDRRLVENPIRLYIPMNTRKLITLSVILIVPSLVPTPASAISASDEPGYVHYGSVYNRVKDISLAGKEEARELTVELNDGTTAVKGGKTTIYVRHEVRGRIMHRRLGEAKVEEFLGKNLIRLKVTKGHKEIYLAYIDSPDMLYAK